MTCVLFGCSVWRQSVACFELASCDLAVAFRAFFTNVYHIYCPTDGCSFDTAEECQVLCVLQCTCTLGAAVPM